MEYRKLILAGFLLLSSQGVLAEEISHGYHYAPDKGDKLGSGASFDYVAAFGRGYLGLKNPSEQSVTVKATQGDQIIVTTRFSIKPGGHVCFTFSGENHFDLSGEGYVEITEDSTLESIPAHCKNYFGLVPDDSLSDSAADIAELIEGGIEILGG